MCIAAGPGQIDQHIKKSHPGEFRRWIKIGKPDSIEMRRIVPR